MLESFEKFLKDLKNSDRYNNFCVEMALSHLTSIKEALDARENNPLGFYKNEMDNAKFMNKALPLLYLIQESGVLNESQSGLQKEEN